MKHQHERAERRMEVMMTGRLAGAQCDPGREWVSIKNLSSHGARILCSRRWTIGEPVLLAESVGEQHLEAKVVYCQRLAADRYAVGLQFTSAAGAHESLPAPGPRTRPNSALSGARSR